MSVETGGHWPPLFPILATSPLHFESSFDAPAMSQNVNLISINVSWEKFRNEKNEYFLFDLTFEESKIVGWPLFK